MQKKHIGVFARERHRHPFILVHDRHTNKSSYVKIKSDKLVLCIFVDSVLLKNIIVLVKELFVKPRQIMTRAKISKCSILQGNRNMKTILKLLWFNCQNNVFH